MRRSAAAGRGDPDQGRRNSFAGLVELNRFFAGRMRETARGGNDSTNDAWLSQTVGDPGLDHPGPLGRGTDELFRLDTFRQSKLLERQKE